MSIKKINGAPTSPEINKIHRGKLGALLSSDHHPSTVQENQYGFDFRNVYERPRRYSSDAPFVPGTPPYSSTINVMMNSNSNPCSPSSSPYTVMSPWIEASPYTKSPWIQQLPESSDAEDEYEEDVKARFSKLGLIGSLFREEGHIYSLAACGDLLYTGSESRNVRVWKDLQDFSGFKSSSGLVKAIVLLWDKIFTGHQDGRIRIWRYLGNKKKAYRRVGNLPTTRDLLIKSVNPRNYVQVRRHRNVPWIKHFDAVSCMSIDSDQGLLYSGSWDKTLKVWRISDSKCLESIQAHDDAVNSVVVGFDGLVFTGSADGTVKAWRREVVGKYVEHVLVETLLQQDHAVTSLAVSHALPAVYAGSSDGLVSFWEREKHFMSFGGVLRGHKLAVLCLAAAGNLVISGSADKSIRVWRRDVGGVHTCAAVLTGHDGPVKCLAVEKDTAEDDQEEEKRGERWIVYSGSLDKSVKVWRVSDHVPSLKELQDQE